MTGFLLLTVEDRFQFESGMLVVVPDFPVGDASGQSSAPLPAKLITPSGDQVPCRLSLHVTHLNIPGSADPDTRSRLTCELHGVTKAIVEIGSRIIVYDEGLADTLGLAELTD